MSPSISSERVSYNSEVTNVVKQTPADYANQPDDLNKINADDLIVIWLKSLGLNFNPFFALNAADDPHLSEYLIELEVFDAVWGDWISFIFESAGGGKTALRVRTSQACWNTQEINRPFPIPYYPPFLKWGTVLPTYHKHLEELALAGTEQLFLGLSYRPHWLLDLDPKKQQQVCELLTWCLSAESLKHYLDELLETFDLLALKQELDPTFNVADPPSPETVQDFCNVLHSLIGQTNPPPDDPSVRWSALCDLLLNQLRFPSVYILLDGLDATLETATDPALLILSLKPLLSHLFDWSENHICIKGFLPIETKQVLSTQAPRVLTATRTASIDWDAKKLKNLVRQRVFVASEGKFDSLDAIVTPGLRDFEDILVESLAAPRPREALTLINHIFAAHIRHNGTVGRIEDRDWAKGLANYQRNTFQQVDHQRS